MYVLNEWIKDKANEKEIHEILEDMNKDIVIIGEKNSYKDGINRLEELGETIIIEKINDGTISFGA